MDGGIPILARIIAVATVAMVAGCATMNAQVADNNLQHLRAGASTIHQAEELLGVPRQTAHNPDGTTILTFYFSNLSTPTLCQLFLVCGVDSYEKTALLFSSTGILETVTKTTVPVTALPPG